MNLVFYVIQQIVNAVSAGSLYAVMAVGLAMVFGILRLINFAYGDQMMVAAYLAAFSLGAGLPLPIAVLIDDRGLDRCLGLIMERVAYRPLRGAPDVALLLSSFAVGQILQNTTLLTTRLAGLPIQMTFAAPDLLSGVLTFGPITVAKLNVVSLVVGIVRSPAADRCLSHAPTLACRCAPRPRICRRRSWWAST